MAKIMRRHYGGEPVSRGVYMNLATLELAQMYDGTLILPGNRSATFIKVPAPLVILLGPIAGLVFAIFLPAVGIAGFLAFIGYKAAQWAQGVGRALAGRDVTQEK